MVNTHYQSLLVIISHPFWCRILLQAFWINKNQWVAETQWQDHCTAGCLGRSPVTPARGADLWDACSLRETHPAGTWTHQVWQLGSGGRFSAWHMDQIRGNHVATIVMLHEIINCLWWFATFLIISVDIARYMSFSRPPPPLLLPCTYHS